MKNTLQTRSLIIVSFLTMSAFALSDFSRFTGRDMSTSAPHVTGYIERNNQSGAVSTGNPLGVFWTSTPPSNKAGSVYLENGPSLSLSIDQYNVHATGNGWEDVVDWVHHTGGHRVLGHVNYRVSTSNGVHHIVVGFTPNPQDPNLKYAESGTVFNFNESISETPIDLHF